MRAIVSFFQGGGEVVEQHEVMGTGGAKNLHSTRPEALGGDLSNKAGAFALPESRRCRVALRGSQTVLEIWEWLCEHVLVLAILSEFFSKSQRPGYKV